MRYEKGSFITVPNKEVLRGADTVVQVVYLWICSFADEKGICFPSRTTLAKCSGCSVRAVDSSIEMLCEAGLLEKTTRKDGNKNLTNVYQIMIVEDGGSAGGAPGVAQEVRTELNPLELNKPVAIASDIFEVVQEDTKRVRKPLDDFEVNYEELCAWAAARRGFAFVSKIKQYGALKKARTLSIGPAKLKSRWIELESQAWYQENGLDWASVVSSFDKRA